MLIRIKIESVLTTVLIVCAFHVTAQQKEVFDLTTYSPPDGWKKEVRENSISYTFTETISGSWCQISVVKSTISKGSLEADFESEWNEFAVKNYGVKDAPQTTEVAETDGWRVKSGAGKFTFNNADASVLLTTASGYERCLSIIAITNSSNYTSHIQRFLESVDLVKPKGTSADQAKNPQQLPNNNGEGASIIGTWYTTASDQSSYAVNNGVNGHITRQYIFNQNGTYQFFIKTFSYFSSKLLLTRESGTYQINGNNLTINPQSSVIQAWSKKDNADKWGTLLSSDKRTLERATYQFSKQYFSGIHEWQLVLRGDKPTQRDGPFVGGSDFSNAWIYGTGNYPIQLPE